MKAGLGVGLVNMASVAAFTLSEGTAGLSQPALERYFWGLMNGVVSAILSMGLLPFLEGMFNVITPMKLIELSNPNQPLLKKLLVEAPGTYHHSVVVGNLAEAAAEAVGGNSLLSRVGAYYHDVGKTKRPYFFIENQMGIENPHDKTSPTLSTLIITSHVRDGAEMAREHKLPEPVVNFIREHHGTTLVSYFYNRAAEADRSEEVVEADFRYEGPKPGSKETAIVMLADSVEAAVRAMDKPAPARIEQAVKKIIGDRLADHQLDRCDLTLRDLDTIAVTFTRVLSGMFHPRIDYPEYTSKEQSEGEGGESSGGSDPVKAEGR
jgi:putative nucleotidyltransferase with HDIG domain